MKKILVTGSNGMLATDFIRRAQGKYDIIARDRQTLDITDIAQVREVLAQVKPDVVLNCAAYTNVDESEDTGKELCFDVNTLGVYHIAQVAFELGIDFITLSTDYVFDGKNQDLYDEDDRPHPLGNYGESKYLGERFARSECPDSIIIRTSWLYGGGKEYKNFVNTMLTLAEKGVPVKVVGDQFGSPTYTVDLVDAIFSIIDQIEKYRGRILHLSGDTPSFGISWYEFAREIFRIIGNKRDIERCAAVDYPSKALRPKYSKLQNNSDIKLRNWKEGLEVYLSTRK